VPEEARAVKVAVAGGGVAGLTAALRLSQRGYKVTLYEEKPWLGGNLGSHARNGVYHDIYPHMYSNFYVNFWDIVENDRGMRRDQSARTDFESRDSFKFLSRDDAHYRELKNAVSLDLRTLWGDLFSGVAHSSPLDMYLYFYSMLDLLAHRFHIRGLLSLSVNGFVRSRPCATEQVAALHDAIVMFIWSVHAAGTSMSSYQNFYRHTFGNVTPLLWLLKGRLQEKIIGPLEKKLDDLKCKIHNSTRVTQVVVDGERVSEIWLQETDFDWDKHKVKPKGTARPAEDPFDYLVLAVPPGALGRLAVSGKQGCRITDRLPQLAHAAKHLPAEPIAVLDLYFTRRLKDIPCENVLITDSDCYFSFIDISQLWRDPRMEDVTALTLAASDYWALPSDNDLENAHHMIRELHRYLPDFDPGPEWGKSKDIDWERSHYQSNKDDVIFITQVGSWDWRPETHYRAIPNLFFAGDFCRNKIDMATVEAAVTSGLNAAVALQQAELRGEPIGILRPPTPSDSTLRAMKLLMAPSAYAAKWWLTATDAAARVSGGKPPAEWGPDLVSMMKLPYAYAADWVETTGALWEDLSLGGRR
jgi:predicted NAD/FAD-dependent oxidoreductase